MEKFAFIMHPISAKKDISRKYPIANYLPEPFLELVLKHQKPIPVSHITGVKSTDGTEAEGWFIGCPLSSRQLMTLPPEFCYKKILECITKAEEYGAKIVGLGAFTSVVGDGGITIAKSANMAVTTGNSYTISTAIDGSMIAANLMDINIQNAEVAIVGATGSIGRTCAMIYDGKCKKLNLIGRNIVKLKEVSHLITKSDKEVLDDVKKGVLNADIVVTVSSAVDAIIMPSFIKSGAVVCDVARPRDVSISVAKERNDVLIIEGGVVKVPGDDLDFHFNFGFPPQTAYACMSETIMLALEKRYESFTLGKEISIDKVNEIKYIAEKHGFKIAGFRSFERALGDDEIRKIKSHKL